MRIRRIISILLCFGLLLMSAGPFTGAAYGKQLPEDEQPAHRDNNAFSYWADKDYAEITIDRFGSAKIVVYPGFNFIEQASSELNWELAINTAVLSKQIYDRREKETFLMLGYDEVRVLCETPAMACPGATMAYKRIVDESGNVKNVFAVVVKGTSTGPDNETDFFDSWMGEMFGHSRDAVISEMKGAIIAFTGKSLEQLEGEDNYFVLTGHSLGAAVANIMSVDDVLLGLVHNDKNKIYTYTFEAPPACINLPGIDVEGMSNAYNFKDEDDFITYATPYFFTAATYGHDKKFNVKDLSNRIFHTLYPSYRGCDYSTEQGKSWDGHHYMLGDFIYILQMGGLYDRDYIAHSKKDEDPGGEGDGAAHYTVLLLDVSGQAKFIQPPSWLNMLGYEYTSDSSIELVKAAAQKLLSDASRSVGRNYIAVVAYSEEGYVVSDFTRDFEALKRAISDIEYDAEADRSIHAGLECAYGLLSKINDENAIKNLLMCTTGLTNCGEHNYEGEYDESTTGSNWENEATKIRIYAYANSAIESVNKIKALGTNVYVIGLFDPIEAKIPRGSSIGDIAKFFRILAGDLASSAETFFPVTDVNQLEFYFGELQEDITGSSKVKVFFYEDTEKEYKTPDNVDLSGGSLGKGGRYEEVLWGPALFEIPSTELFRSDIVDKESANYNLAMLCGALSAAAYDPVYLRQAYLDLGVAEEDILLKNYDGDLAYSIAGRKMKINDEDTFVMMVTMRGLQTYIEKRKLLVEPLEFMESAKALNLVTEFYTEILRGMMEYNEAHGEYAELPMKILITGHDLGGAAANLLAANLTMNLQKVDTALGDGLSVDDIYAYTFGAFNYLDTEKLAQAGATFPLSNGCENIINIYNLMDTYSPLVPESIMWDVAELQRGLKMKTGLYGLFGQYYFFRSALSMYVPEPCKTPTHVMGGYLQAIKNYLLGDLMSNGNKVRVVICCPVDVEIYRDGECICRIVDDRVVSASGDVTACVNNDEKTIVLPADIEYDVVIKATGSGKMEYLVQNLDADRTDDVMYVNVTLENGKVMETSIPADLSSENVKFRSVTSDGEQAEILADGREEVIPKEPEPTVIPVTPQVTPTVAPEEPSATLTAAPSGEGQGSGEDPENRDVIGEEEDDGDAVARETASNTTWWQLALMILLGAGFVALVVYVTARVTRGKVAGDAQQVDA